VFFRFLGDQVESFLDYADEGSKFVFGDEGYLLHRMAFKVGAGICLALIRKYLIMVL